MIGIVEEQNADRARLFMQWQGMAWPVLVDTFDLLEVSVVPLTFAIDEHGVVRQAGLRMGDAAAIESTFLDRTWPAPATDPTVATPGSTEAGTLRDMTARAGAGAPADVASALDAWLESVHRRPDDGWAHFRLAAAYRLRYDSPARRAGDFQHAVDHWQRALDLDPNNYIWRRRIQQYGPRLAKPYPFYDWIEQARAEIRARGETPVPLSAEPTASEVARPSRTFEAGEANSGAPDPRGRVRRDGADGAGRPLIRAEVTTVPRTVAPGDAARAHLVFRPDQAQRAHWNNETEPLRVWLDPPTGWRLDRQLLSVPNAAQPTSTETRAVEVELEIPDDIHPGSYDVPAYAVYYVCEDVDGTCLYRRQDLVVPIAVRASAR